MASITDYEVFLQVAQSQSLTAASAKLGMTKSSVSKKIKKLEQSLQVELFSRANYRLELTEYGIALLQQCTRLQHELDNIKSLAAGFHAQPEGKLHVVAFSYFAKNMILPRLPQFLAKYPKLELTIDTSERVPNLNLENIDIALGFSIPAPNLEDIMQKSMGVTNYVLCGAPDYFAEHGIPQSLEALAQHQYINHTSRPSSFLKLTANNIYCVAPHLTFNNIEAMIEAAVLGLGLVQLPMYMAAPLLETKKLITVLDQEQRTGEYIYYYYPKFRHVQPKIRAFIDFFLSA